MRKYTVADNIKKLVLHHKLLRIWRRWLSWLMKVVQVDLTYLNNGSWYQNTVIWRVIQGWYNIIAWIDFCDSPIFPFPFCCRAFVADLGPSFPPWGNIHSFLTPPYGWWCPLFTTHSIFKGVEDNKEEQSGLFIQVCQVEMKYIYTRLMNCMIYILPHPHHHCHDNLLAGRQKWPDWEALGGKR